MTSGSGSFEGDGSVGFDAAAALAEEQSVLLARLDRSAGDMEALIDASRDSNADDEHDPEGQTIAYERSQLSATTDHARAQLAEIEAALGRLEDGTYGVCEVGGEPIAAERLEARPTARTCVAHAGVGGGDRAR